MVYDSLKAKTTHKHDNNTSEKLLGGIASKDKAESKQSRPMTYNNIIVARLKMSFLASVLGKSVGIAAGQSNHVGKH